VLVQVGGDARARDRAEVHAHVESLGAARLPQGLGGALGELRQLDRLGVVEVGVVGHVTVRDDHEVTRVVRVEVEHREHGRAAGDDQPVLIGELRDLAEGAAVVGPRAGGLVLALDVGHPVWGPQSLEVVRHTGAGLLDRL
jgi:hypothetical protein